MDKRKKFDFFKLYDIVAAIVNMFLLLSFGILCVYSILFELINFNNNTIALTNFGFAILLGLSSVSFSWARNLTTDDDKKAKRLNRCGIDALYGALTFLMGSGFKYIAFATDNKYLQIFYEEKSRLIYIPKVLAFICFAIAVVHFYNVITELIKIIFISTNRDWDYERGAKPTKQKPAEAENTSTTDKVENHEVS
jgi:hypothetical protein